MLSKPENESIKEVVRNSLINGSSYYEGDYRVIQTGKIISIIVRLNAVYTDDNIVSGCGGLVEDVSERKKNESIQKALFDISEEASRKTSINKLYRKFHEIIKTLMSADNIYIAMHNSETNLITFPYHVDQYDANPETLEFKNGLTEYILRTKKSQIITEAMDKALQAKGEVDLTGESSKVWVGIYLEFEGVYSGVLALQDYENENAYSEKDLKILQFVSRQIVKVLDMQYANRRLNESFNELSVAKKELEIINKNKDRFFSIIAHDLRSPFNTLLGISEMISGDMDEMSMREVKEISSVIHSSTQNLFKLIENLLSWSRLQMGSFYIEPKEIKVRDIANSVLEILDITANEKEVLIQNNIKNMKAFADKECVKTVFRNLVSNAIKFTKRSEGIINLTSKELPEFIEITIADNGVGIKSSIVKNLFSINEKTSYAGTENESGTGLGLILCKDLIEKNNGKIWVESKYGKGSRFTFTLPKTTSN
jgi:signal transduction histidine kinase